MRIGVHSIYPSVKESCWSPLCQFEAAPCVPEDTVSVSMLGRRYMQPPMELRAVRRLDVKCSMYRDSATKHGKTHAMRSVNMRLFRLPQSFIALHSLCKRLLSVPLLQLACCSHRGLLSS